MARLRSTATSQQPAKTAPSTARQALKEKTNTSRTQVPRYEDDGDTEGLVKEKKGKRGRPKKTVQASDELMMAGGLGLSEDAPEQPSEPPTTTDELAKSDGLPTATAKPNRRPPRTARKVVQTAAQSKVMEGLKQRMEKTAQGERAKKAAPSTSVDAAASSSDTIALSAPAAKESGKAAVERSEFSLSPSPPPAGKLSAIKGRRSSVAIPGSVLKAQNTPGLDASIMALKNFKRRPRQPSMLQMVQQRTASARPSLANTAVDNTAIDDSSVFDLGISDDGEDDFAPEAEGTPLHKAKSKRISSTSMQKSASGHSMTTTVVSKAATKKRNSDEADVSSGSLGALKAKRRKTFENEHQHVDQAPSNGQKAVSQSSSERAETPQPGITSDVHVLNSPSTSTPPTDPPSSSRYHTAKEDDFVVPSTEREQVQSPENVENAVDHEAEVTGTMGDPLSSSPAQQNTVPVAPELADPVSQETAVLETPKPKKRSKAIFTSTLQSLLPKRRQPLRPRGRKSEYDVDSDSDDDTPIDVSHLDDDQDELGSAVRRKNKATPAKTTKTGKRGRPSKAAAVSTKKLTAASKRAISTATSGKKVSKTYGRAPASDKENDDYELSGEPEEELTLPEVSISMEEAVQSKEVEAAKNKFAEVDDWDMEFESMSQEFHRSSSQEWR